MCSDSLCVECADRISATPENPSGWWEVEIVPGMWRGPFGIATAEAKARGASTGRIRPVRTITVYGNPINVRASNPR